MLCPVEGWGQTAGISRWGMNTMPTFLVRSWCQDLLTHDSRGFQFHRNSGHLSNISATEIVRSSVLTNKIANSKQRNNGTNSMPATVKPQFFDPSKVAAEELPRLELPCDITPTRSSLYRRLSLYIFCIFLWVFRFVQLETWEVALLHLMHDAWFLGDHKQYTFICLAHEPSWIPGILASSFRYYDVDFHIDGSKEIVNNRSISIDCTVTWPWRKRSTITKEAVQRFQASVRARMSGWGLDVFCTVRFWCNAKLGSFHPSQMLKTFL